LLRFFPALKFAWGTGLLYLMLSPEAGNNEIFSFVKFKGVDRLAHFVLFFGWTFLHFQEAVYTRILPPPKTSKIYWVALSSLILGIGTETVQNFIPNRQTELCDWVANVLGSITAIGAVKMIRRKKTDLI